jgi:hypothetical protein
MTETNPVNSAILSRIERLERQNRNLKRGTLASLAIASVFVLSLGVMGQGQTQTPAPRKKPVVKAAPAPVAPPEPVLPKNIEAESFILKDPNGHVRAELSMDGEGPSLKFRDQNGAALVTLSLLDSATGGPLLLLSDPQHHASVSASALSGQGSQLSLIGERADIQARMAVSPDGTSLDLSDADGFTTSIGNGVKAAKSGQVKKTTAASIALYNKDRKVLWSQP